MTRYPDTINKANCPDNDVHLYQTFTMLKSKFYDGVDADCTSRLESTDRIPVGAITN